MNTLDRVLEEYQRTAHPNAGLQDEAAQRLRLLGLPVAGDEHWQHANLRALNQVTNFVAAGAGATLPATTLPPPLAGFERLVFVDGHLRAEPGIPATGAASLPADNSNAANIGDPDLRFALLAALFGGVPVTLRLQGAQSIELIYVCTGIAGSVYPRLRLQLADNARVTLVERHIGATAADALLCTDVQIRLAPRAELTHYRLHAGTAGTQLIDNLSAALAAHSSYRSHHLAVGATNIRTSNTILLAGDGAAFSWRGLATVQEGETYDSLVRVEHQAPATRAEHRFRGIAAGHSRITCNADVQVRAAARGAKVSQSLRGLTDGAGASINLQPRLTIDTDDIQATHGATTGQLDDNLLFYLLTRGIDPETARNLLKWAFLGDVLSTIEIPALRREAERLAAGHLTDTLATGLTSAMELT